MDSASNKSQIKRRTFLKATTCGIGGLLLGGYSKVAQANNRGRVTLVPPIVTGNSTEICLNSRASEHNGLTGTPTDQQVSNVLWAAGRAPYKGNKRNILYRDSTGTYIYDPLTHSLNTYSSTTTNNGFRISYDSENDYDSGVSYTFAFSASVATWQGTQAQLASCPQGSDIVFGIRSVQGLRDDLVAVSSDHSLRNPDTDGANLLENVIADVEETKWFNPNRIVNKRELSQILWGGYGCTPHVVNSGRAGLTVASSWALYHLTNRIYVLDYHVSMYSNRIGVDLATKDHRIAHVNNIDARDDIKQILPNLPKATCYILLCLPQAEISKEYSRLEAGFAAGGIILESSALGVGWNFVTDLTAQEQSQIQTAVQIPTNDVPVVVLALGSEAKASLNSRRNQTDDV